MARKYLVPIDLTKQELQNARIQNLASAPSSPVAGQIYFNTSDNTLYFYSGTAWVAAKTNPYSYADTGETTDISITATESNGTSANLARADHQHAGPGFGNTYAIDAFGLESNSGVSNMVARADHSHGSPVHDAAAHSEIKISDLAAPSNDVSFNNKKITNLMDPANAQEAATKNYVDTRKVTDLTAPTSAFSMNSQKITNLATPTSDADASTKKYVDDKTINTLSATTADFSMANHKITNLADPVNPSDAANKAYVDGAISGLDWKNSVNLLSTTNVPLTGSTGLVIDGHSALGPSNAGYRILLTGQTTTADKGIYVYADNGTTYTLTRAEDANQYQELINASVFVSEGTTYGKTSWVQSNHYLTSFAGQDWVQFSGQGTYVAGNGLALTGNSFAFNPTSTGGLQADGTGASIKIKSDGNGSGLEVKSTGLAVVTGTGLTINTNLVSIDTNVVARKYSETLTGALSNNVYVTHNFGTKDVTVQVYTVADGSQVEVDITRATNDSVILGFAVAPTSGVYRAVVIG